MNLKQHFDIKRFFYLFKNDLLLNFKSDVFIASGYAIILYIAMLLSMTRDNEMFDSNGYLTIFSFSMIAMCIFAGTSFPALNSKNTSHTFIMTPGSNFEKFIIQFIIRIVITLIFLFVSFWIIAHLARISALQFESIKISGKFIDPFKYSMLRHGYSTEHFIVIIYSIFFTFGISVFSFRLIFKNFAFVKSSITIVGLLFILLFVTNIIYNLFFPVTLRSFFDIDPELIYGKNSILGLIGAPILFFILSFLFILPFGYFKLKEKQL